MAQRMAVLQEMKGAMEKDMLARGLERADAQNCAVSKNRPTSARGKSKPVSKRTKMFIITPGTYG